MKRVLIIQTAFIGDVILASSMVEAVQKHRPDWKIDILVRKGNESLLSNNPHINEVLIWDKSKKVRSLFKNIRKIRSNKYYAVFNVQRFLNSGIATALSMATYKIGFKQNPASFLFTHKIDHKIPHKIESGHFHEVQRNAQLLTPVIEELVPNEIVRPKLYFNEVINTKIREITLEKDPYIVLAPTSVWFTKQWSFERWTELSQILSQKYQLFFIGAPSDKNSIDSIINGISNCHNLAGKLSLLESARLMMDAHRVFVNDSAPLHLASSVNAKTTSIFCSTVPEFGYTPLSEEAKVISSIPRLDCQPCGLHGKKACPLGHFKCSLNISAARVANTTKDNTPPLYHIIDKASFDKAQSEGSYQPKSLEEEGFIHLSFGEQVEETGKLFYQGVEDLLLIEVEASSEWDVRIEDGFPHLYSELPMDAVISVREISF